MPGAGSNASQWVDVLAEVPLFAGLSRRHVRKVAGVARVARFHDGAFIARQGEAGDACYVLLDGEATVLRRGYGPLTLGSGNFFGEMTLLDGGPRTADVVAQQDVVCLMIPRAGFLKLLRGEPSIAVAMLAEMSRRLRAVQSVG